MFNPENIKQLQETCTKINNLCDENVNGQLMFSQLIFLGRLLEEFVSNPIVANSGVIKK